MIRNIFHKNVFPIKNWQELDIASKYDTMTL